MKEDDQREEASKDGRLLKEVQIGSATYNFRQLCQRTSYRYKFEVSILKYLYKILYGRHGEEVANKVENKLKERKINRELTFIVTKFDEKKRELFVGGMVVENARSRFHLGERVANVASWFVSEEDRSRLLAQAMADTLLESARAAKVAVEAKIVPETTGALLASPFGRLLLRRNHFTWRQKRGLMNPLIRLEPREV